MKRLTSRVIDFFHRQSYVIASTVDEDGCPHSACKGIVEIRPDGTVYLLDLFRGTTHENLRRNPLMSITAVDEHRFEGYCLKGRATVVQKPDIDKKVLRAWEDRMTARITQRLLKNIHGDSGVYRHAEALLPAPEYLIIMDVEEVVSLAPHKSKEE